MADNNSDDVIAGATRIQDADGFVGTIVYVGPVASAKNPNEHYAGVIWDDPSRGKHDGSVVCRRTNQLVRHFSCQHPCGASFLRLTKLDLGVALDADVLRSKYVAADSTELVAPNNLLPHTARTSRGNEKPIEFYGELKIRARQQLEDLNTISLRRMGIARLDRTTADSLQEYRHLLSVDLAGNLLSNWDTVLQIMEQFPNLKTFSLAANRIRDPSPEILDKAEQYCSLPPFSSLQMINLNQCGITSIKTLLWIGKLLPELEILCLAHADLSELDLEFSLQAAGTLQHLRELDLTDCHLSSWNQQIVPLCSSLLHLENLHLDENQIDTTNVDPTNESSIFFPQLQSLQLAGTQIATWQDLDGVGMFPQLKSLRFRRCPLLSTMGIAQARALTIARLTSLTKLNASPVTPKERLEAEKLYVSSVASQLLHLPVQQQDGNDNSTTREEFLLGHKPFLPLMEKYRDSIAAAAEASSPVFGDSSTNASATHNRVVNVTIQSMSPSSCHQEALVRRLPGSLQIKRIKAMCARAFGLDPDLQQLQFSSEFDALPTEMDDDDHTLAYFGVSDGATIYMHEIDVEEIQRQQEKTKQERKSKMEQQEAIDRMKQEQKRQMKLNQVS